jgi:hypothetical protein
MKKIYLFIYGLSFLSLSYHSEAEQKIQFIITYPEKSEYPNQELNMQKNLNRFLNILQKYFLTESKKIITKILFCCKN